MNQKKLGETDGSLIRKSIFIALGPLLCILMLILPPPGGMSEGAVKVAAAALMMIVWWTTEAVPMALTALLPLIMFPLLGFSSIAASAAGYANHLIFLYIGGFIIALTLERWNIHKRIAYAVLEALGTNPRRILLGFMCATGLVSMWISNTATTVMMLPVASAVIGRMGDILRRHYPEFEARSIHKRMATAVMLGVAYSASIGGIGTIIGTPPNLVLAGALKEIFQYEISFVAWMGVGVPLAVLFIFIVWLLFINIYRLPPQNIPEAESIIRKAKTELGSMDSNEKKVLTVFILTAAAWISRKWLITPLLPKVNDSVISLIGAALLFIIPVSREKRGEAGPFIMNWETAVKLPWGIVLLFGGGFSLAAAFTKSELSLWIGEQLSGLAGLPLAAVIASIVLLVTFLTEITSNTASTTLLMPIMGALASVLNADPVVIMGVAAIAASCAFMLPVATPPNAIVFSSGSITIPQMVRTGIILNLISVILVTLLGLTLIPWILG